MFWPQLIILEENPPLKAIKESFNTVKKDISKTGIIFFLNFLLLLGLLYLTAFFVVNPIINLVFILLIVYLVVFYVMTTFIYLEKYTEINSDIRPDSIG